MRRRLENLAASVAFAEAGDRDTAQWLLLRGQGVLEGGREKILAVTSLPAEAHELGERAVVLAERMSLNIVAVSALDLPGRRDQDTESRRASEAWFAALDKRLPSNVFCAHVLHFGSARRALRQLAGSLRGVAFGIILDDGKSRSLPRTPFPLFRIGN